MTHLWVRAEQRPNETRVGLTPGGATALLKAGYRVTVEDSSTRVIPTREYVAAGCEIAPPHSWHKAPSDAFIFGLKELPDGSTPITHRHVMFGHAYKGQAAGRVLLDRFRRGNGALYDIEYLVDDTGRRVAAFGYWAGFAGAAVALGCWIAQKQACPIGSLRPFSSKDALLSNLAGKLASIPQQMPSVLIVGALGRVGTGASTFCEELGISVTGWDIAETAKGGPFPEILAHDVFLNCILARPGCPVFVASDALTQPRRLSVIGDIACDPTSDFSPIKVYDRATDWLAPAIRVAEDASSRCNGN